jgi:heme/copper-type cytochrome/quinol oxidase subunit 2
MNAIRFGLLLVVVAAAVTALLWLLGYWIIAFAVGIAVLVIGAVVYAATRAGSASRRRHGHLAT